MECKKEEAMRAKEIAEKMMQNNDFVGAQRIAFKAQQLYPQLDKVSQMLTLCEVLCSAEKKILPWDEMDWYAILQITQTADEASIKKKYRKFALLVHPDKNKFPGAEAAFKLILEAQTVLADPQKRTLYDIRYMQSMRSAAPPRKAHQPEAKTSAPPPRQAHQPEAKTSAPPPRQAHQPEAKTSAPPPRQTRNKSSYLTSEQYASLKKNVKQQNQNLRSFRTMCPSCHGLHCRMNISSTVVRSCRSCETNCSKSKPAQQKEVPGQGAKVGSQRNGGNPPGSGTGRTFGSTGTREQQSRFSKKRTSDFGRDSKSSRKESKERRTSDVGRDSKNSGRESNRRPEKQDKSEEFKPSKNKGGKKRRRKSDEEECPENNYGYLTSEQLIILNKFVKEQNQNMPSYRTTCPCCGGRHRKINIVTSVVRCCKFCGKVYDVDHSDVRGSATGTNCSHCSTKRGT